MTVRVGKDGRLRVPRSEVQAAGLAPGDIVAREDIALKRRGIGRRAAIRMSFAGMALAGMARVADVEGFVAMLARLRRWFEPEADPRLIAALFGMGPAGTGAIIPAGDHTFAPPPHGEAWYPIEKACAAAYFERFSGPDCVLRRVSRGFPQVQAEDGVVALGSQVSNYFVRNLLGIPWDKDPHLRVFGPQWATDLHWNLYTPAGAEKKYRRQFGVDWLGTEHEIVSSTGASVRAKWDGDVQQDDYLLITALPRKGANPQRALAFAGIHAAGSLAAETLLRDAPARLLGEIEKATGKERHYQALLHVAVEPDSEGEAKPKKITLVDARPLDVSFHS